MAILGVLGNQHSVQKVQIMLFAPSVMKPVYKNKNKVIPLRKDSTLR